MPNLRNFSQYLFRFATLGWSLSLLLSLGLHIGLVNPVQAASPDTAPQQLKELLGQMETAANSQDLDKVMQFYSPDFTNSDGWKRASVSEALKQFWGRYTRLNYRTELISWEQKDGELIAETVTYIQGSQRSQGRIIQLASTLKSRQHFLNQKLVRQEILSEQTELTSGQNPPKVQVLLPEKVRIGEKFNFDVIVTEPLGDDLLLGAALEEEASASRYLNPGSFELELLPAGGIFKVATAPAKPETQWLSAILVRGDGMTLVTRRVQVNN